MECCCQDYTNRKQDFIKTREYRESRNLGCEKVRFGLGTSGTLTAGVVMGIKLLEQYLDKNMNTRSLTGLSPPWASCKISPWGVHLILRMGRTQSRTTQKGLVNNLRAVHWQALTVFRSWSLTWSFKAWPSHKVLHFHFLLKPVKQGRQVSQTRKFNTN